MSIEAVYKPHLDFNLNNNPLSEAVHVELSREQLIKNLTEVPYIQENFWDLPEIYQQTQLRQLTEVHIPVPQTWNLYNKILSLILFGYVRRNPLSKEMRMQYARIAECMRLGKLYNPGPMIGIGPTTAASSLVYGDSGSGKTKCIRSILGQVEQVINHKIYQGEHFKKKQLVWISFDLPPNGSPKAMAANFFRAVDSALDTDYAEQWSDHKKFSADQLIAAMQHIAATHCLGIVHIDELQFMLGYKKIKDSPSLQTLETLFNKIGVPIIQSSTQQGVELFDSLEDSDHRLGHDSTTVRRMLNDREFKFSTHAYGSEYFTELFNALFPSSLIYGIQNASNENFKIKFQSLSCGLPAIMTRLAHMHHETLQTLLMKDGCEYKNYFTFDPQLLDRVYTNQFHLIDPALKALRAGNREDYEKKIRDKTTNKTTYTNKDVIKEQKKVRTPVPKILKNHDESSTQPSTVSKLQLDNFLIGIEDSKDAN
ncbi:ATP-binding protein [Moritella sp. Urea-trap-13]|uniref:ATP-binding protein n=1 Tax=Moritella sp. Urea-trap-13 TaxID=2058327 RepID=UPI000C34077D|nr:ATP-binding protein [Moritella sp. Urea-trap-13]PKH04764.1 hypothetical protein CXF93_21350 [Moritella sp. Urea-trap-13]